jgi:hypothetical protein
VATGQTVLVAGGVPSQTLVSSVTELTRWTPRGIWVERVNYDDDLYGVPGGYGV